MVGRSSSTWLTAATGGAIVAVLSVSLCAAVPVGAADVASGAGSVSPVPRVAVDERPLGTARDLQSSSPALAPLSTPDPADSESPADGTTSAIPASADRLAKALAQAAPPASSRVDPVRLLRRLPDGLPQLTYRVCSRTPDAPVSCTDSLPAGVPALVDVDGAGANPDLLVDALPAASTDALTTAATQRDPQRLARALTTLTDDGLAVLAVRTSTSRAPLRARMWVDYKLPSGTRLTAGYDGLYRGAGLPTGTLGVFTVEQGADRIEADVRTAGAAGALGIDAARDDGSAALVARVSPVPASVRVSSTVGPVTRVVVENSAPVEHLEVASTGGDAGTARAAFTKVPTRVGYRFDVPGRHLETTASDRVAQVHLLARVPVDGDTWSSSLDAASLPGRLTADFDAGALSIRSFAGAVGTVSLAVTNHGGATVPRNPAYVALHHDTASGALDAAVAAPGLRHVDYALSATGRQSFVLGTAPAAVALDTDILAGRDLEYFVGGFLTAPGSIAISTADGRVRYTADRSLGIRLTAASGKTEALNGLFVPLYDQGVAVRVAGCDGAGCETDDSEFCSGLARCFAVGANIAFPNAPTRVTVDLNAATTTIGEFRPTGPLQVYLELDGLVANIARLRSKVTLAGLPAWFGVTVGRVGNTPGNPATASLDYRATGPVGSIEAGVDTAAAS